MDRLAAMHTFVRVAELNSFSAVAQQQGVARSVITRQVAALEEHLGVKLMARSTRRVALTSAGAAYLEKCRVILNLVEAAEAGVAEQRQSARGHIRVSLPLSYGLRRMVPPLLDFARAHPLVTLDMDYTDRRVNLIEEGVDLAIAAGETIAFVGPSSSRNLTRMLLESRTALRKSGGSTKRPFSPNSEKPWPLYAIGLPAST